MFRKISKAIALTAVFSISAIAMACPGGAIRLNEVSVVRGDYLQTGSFRVLVQDADRSPGSKIPIKDKIGGRTHYVEIVKIEGDSEYRGQYRVIATTYRIYDNEGTHLLGTYRVATNYHGNGRVVRSMPNPYAASKITRGKVIGVGCNSIDLEKLL